MPQSHPLIRLRREEKLRPRVPGRQPRFPQKISSLEQKTKFSNKFTAISRSVEAWEKGIEVASDPSAVMPERALVFDLIGPVREFEAVASSLGFEWLRTDRAAKGTEPVYGELDESESLDDDEDAADGASLYLTIPSHSGLQSMLENWAKFSSGLAANNKSEAVWWKLFAYLNDIRTWSPRDRIHKLVAAHISHLLQKDPDAPVIVEVDLWFRQTREERLKAMEILTDLIKDDSTTILDSVLIEEIHYHAVLVRVPASVAREVAEMHGTLANANSVMTIRAQTAQSPLQPKDSENMLERVVPALSDKPCIGAMIDGYPIEHHDLLNGRLIVLETDVTADVAPVDARYHGTAMASLIMHGDLHETGPVLDRPLAVVPVLTGQGNRESVPSEKLAIGVIQRAIQALHAGDKDKGISQKQIVVINHSICNSHAPFLGKPSPWAALLDYYGHEYGMLFVVSAGNRMEGVEVEGYDEVIGDDDKAVAAKAGTIMLAVQRGRHQRNLLSPAETVNGLTVGALHIDSGPTVPASLLDPYPGLAMASLFSASGPGVARAIKPDLVEAGGKSIGILSSDQGKLSIRPQSNPKVGQLVAIPDTRTGLPNLGGRSTGTSNAAALTTRKLLQLADVVEETYEAGGEKWLEKQTRAVILKALLIHGCRWNSVAQSLDGLFLPEETTRHVRRRASITGLMGYGHSNTGGVANGSDNRVTLLAEDSIKHDQQHEYQIPLPSALFNTKDIRRIVITLAWSTPILVGAADYRGVVMNFVDKDGKRKIWNRVSRVLQPDSNAAARGTVTHLVLEGETKTQLTNQKELLIGVQARSTRREFDNEPVPYALAVTIELASNQKSTVYAEVREVIRLREEVRLRQRNQSTVRT
jgi:hypothetical protein